jgi:hypothetical protein
MLLGSKKLFSPTGMLISQEQVLSVGYSVSNRKPAKRLMPINSGDSRKGRGL